MTTTDEWITTAQAAKISGYTLSNIVRLIQGNKINAKRFGRAWQVSKQSLLKYKAEIEKIGGKRGPKTPS